MATSDILGFGQQALKGSPFAEPVTLGKDFPNSQITFSGTARFLASSESGSNGYFPGANIVVADFDNPFLEISLRNLPQSRSGQFSFRYSAPNVGDGDLSIEIFDAQGTRIGGQSLARTNGTYEIFPESSPTPDRRTSVEFQGTPSTIRIGGVLREFAIDDVLLTTDTITVPPNQAPDTTTPPTINAQVGTSVELTGLGGTDSDGTVVQFVITSLPSVEQGTLFLGNFGTPVTANQQIPADQIGNLFFQASANFTGASFDYAAIDNQNAQDISPATVTINSSGSTIPIAVDDPFNPGTRVFTGTSNPDNFDALTALPDPSLALTAPINIDFSSLLANDTLNGGNITNVSLPVNSTVSIGNNRVVFTPNQGFPPGSFRYALTNSSGSDTATVTISTINYELRGFEGNDTLLGGPGNDTIFGNTENDFITGRAGVDSLLGGQGSDTLLGGAGNDIIVGGVGADFLTGNAGADTFQYNSPSEGSDSSLRGNDIIADFSVGEGDRIAVSASGFGGGLTAGPLNSNQFSTSFSGVTPSTRFIYSEAFLYYDNDGSGSSSAIIIANLQGNSLLTSGSIVVF